MTRRGQAIRGYPAMRVFVYGHEVTEDVLSCTVTTNDGRAPNTCEFELANKNDRYILTELDLPVLYPDIDLTAIVMAEIDASLWTDKVDNPGSMGALSDGALSLRRTVDFKSQAQNLAGQHEASVLPLDHIQMRLREDIEAYKKTIDKTKHAILTAKFVEEFAQPFEQEDIAVPHGDASTVLPHLKGVAKRYPLQAGDCIFTSNDAVRVFWRDPYRPRIWWHMFAGFLTDWTDSVTADDVRIVRIRCEDPSRILRYARATTQPGVFDIDHVKTNRDFALRTEFKKSLADLTMPEIMFTLLYGPDMAGTWKKFSAFKNESGKPIQVVRSGINGGSIATVPPLGAGSFNFDRSVIMMLGPKDKQEDVDGSVSAALLERTVAAESLSTWQALVDHQVRVGDIHELCIDADTAAQRTEKITTNGEISIQDVVKEIGENPHLYPIDGGRLLMLLPASLGGNINRLLIEKDLGANLSLETQWTTRLSIIYDTLERLNYSFYATGKGDLVCEMPLYDFHPKHFGEIERAPRTIKLKSRILGSRAYAKALRKELNQDPSVSSKDRAAFQAEAIEEEKLAQKTTERDNALEASRSLVPSEPRGPYAIHYKFNRRDMISWERSFVDEKIRTQFVVPRTSIPGLPSLDTAGNALTTTGQRHGVRTAYALIPAFGVRAEQSDVSGFISSLQSAILFADIKLNQINADARSAHVDVVPRLGLGVNRPLEFSERQFIATTRQVTHRLVWGESGELSTAVEVNYMRGWSGQVGDDNRPLYERIGGFGSAPLNYAIRLQVEKPPASSKAKDK